MSSSFDTMQQAINWLTNRLINDNTQAEDVLQYLSEAIDDLHSYSHSHNDEPNRVAGRSADLLLTAMRYEDPKERAAWLRIKRGNYDNRSL